MNRGIVQTMTSYFILVLLSASSCDSKQDYSDFDTGLLLDKDNVEQFLKNSKEYEDENSISIHGVDEPHIGVVMQKLKTFENLERLFIANSNLDDISVVFELQGLRELTVRNSGVTEVPVRINTMESLMLLDLSKNQIKQLPFVELDSLKELILSQNKFTSFPESILYLTSLEVLDLRYNEIKGIPEELFKLEKLEHLFLYGNRFTSEDIQLAKKLLPYCNISIKPPEFEEPIIH